MGKLSLTAFVTLDGVHQAPGGREEDRRDGFEHGGWSFPYDDEDFGQFITEVFGRAGAFLLGRHTYEIFAGFWPKVTDPADPVAGKLNSLPKYVASSSITRPEWAGTTVISGDLAKEVTAIKENTEGELQVHGSAALAQSSSRSTSSTPCTCCPSRSYSARAAVSSPRAQCRPRSGTRARASRARASPSTRTTWQDARSTARTSCRRGPRRGPGRSRAGVSWRRLTPGKLIRLAGRNHRP